MHATIPDAGTLTAVQRARLPQCPQCWAASGVPCQRQPAGDHLARWARAARRGVVTRAELVAVVAGLEVIAGHVIIGGAR